MPVTFEDLFGSRVKTQTPVTLNDLETQIIVAMVADARYKYSRANGLEWGFETERDPNEQEILAFGAEIAYCKLANLYPDITYDRVGDYDCITTFGKTVDVKWTQNPSGLLLVKRTPKVVKNPPYCFALMVGSPPNYLYCGYILAKDLMVPERLVTSIDVNGRIVKLSMPNWKADQSELYHSILIM